MRTVLSFLHIPSPFSGYCHKVDKGVSMQPARRDEFETPGVENNRAKYTLFTTYAQVSTCKQVKGKKKAFIWVLITVVHMWLWLCIYVYRHGYFRHGKVTREVHTQGGTRDECSSRVLSCVCVFLRSFTMSEELHQLVWHVLLKAYTHRRALVYS